MMWSWNSLLSLLVLGLLNSVKGGAVWTEDSCSTNHTDYETFYVYGNTTIYGLVTDAICCNVTDYAAKCAALDNRDDCQAENRCHWFETGTAGGPKCAANRDEHNNVCCRPEQVLTNCMNLLDGKCPKAWQIPKECCPAPYNKYSASNPPILATDSPDLACCNAPCTAIELVFKGNESLGIDRNTSCKADMSINCGPHQRSAFSAMNMFGNNNINPMLLTAMMGFPVGSNLQLGKNTGNSLFGQMESASGDVKGMMALTGMMKGEESKKEPLEEITVDDFFNALIESLDSDKDVFEYNRDIYSDQVWGKQSIGGFDPFADGLMGLMGAMSEGADYDGVKLPTGDTFMESLFASNPMGPAMAQMMFGTNFGLPSSSFKTNTNPWAFPGMSGAMKLRQEDPLYYQNPVYQCTASQPTYPNYYYDYEAQSWKKCPKFDQQSKSFQCKQASPPYPGQYFHYVLSVWKQCKLSPSQEPTYQCQQSNPPRPGWFYDYDEGKWSQCPILPHQQPDYQCNDPYSQYQGYYFDYSLYQWFQCSSRGPREESD